MYELSIEVRGSRVSVVSGGNTMCKNVEMGGMKMSGPVGVAVFKSRAKFENFRLEQVKEGGSVKAPYTGDDPKFVQPIESEIIDTTLSLNWDDIASLETAKRLLKEAVVLPMLMPDLFVGIREPWKGVLLFGPPGTGKTMLAKAVASQAKTTFFNISAATLVSKWHGESEKMVKVLFNMARYYAPSTIFFDEIDCLMGMRGANHEHESSRRLKSELLTQMDGMMSADGAPVMVLATSNKPWDLDDAFRRRLEKRIYIPLPDKDARVEMFRLNTSSLKLVADIDFAELSNRTGGFSGADIKLLCRDACMMPMRELMLTKSPEEIKALKDAGELELQVSMRDFLASLQNINASVGADETAKYEMWSNEFGSS
jgi:katanin p60 ATPase-containing subunit A1